MRACIVCCLTLEQVTSLSPSSKVLGAGGREGGPLAKRGVLVPVQCSGRVKDGRTVRSMRRTDDLGLGSGGCMLDLSRHD